MIQSICTGLNSKIHNTIFYAKHLQSNSARHGKAFTSLDLVRDTQDAIEEFIDLPEASISARNTLHIYGVLQALFCQQDGLIFLYEAIEGKELKPKKGETKLNSLLDEELFASYKENIQKIRNTRNQIAGHPVSTESKNKFYFISHGSHSKYIFEYAGYIPEFYHRKVNLEEFINQQREFALAILAYAEQVIDKQIMEHKDQFKNTKLTDFTSGFHYDLSKIYEGIWRNYPLVGMCYNGITSSVGKIKEMLSEMNYGKIPEGVSDDLRQIDYILESIGKWIEQNQLQDNKDAEIFMVALEKKLEELTTILEEIDASHNAEESDW